MWVSGGGRACRRTPVWGGTGARLLARADPLAWNCEVRPELWCFGGIVGGEGEPHFSHIHPGILLWRLEMIKLS